MEYLIVHYSEIAIKGKNRLMFEKALIRNLKKALGSQVIRVQRRRGRIACEIAPKGEKERISEALKLMPGVAHFSFAVKAGLTIQAIRKAVKDAVKGREFRTFKVVAKRSFKEFPKTSMDLNQELGGMIIKETGKKAKMVGPDLKVFVDVGEKEAFVFTDKVKGLGGLPVGSSGKLVASLSGGIDSPVASAMMMKRGCRVVFVHIHNKTLANDGMAGKIDDIVEQLTRVQLESRLIVVPFEEIQKEIIMSIPSRYRMIVYRRFMMRILNRIAEKERAGGIITGDNVGQVASQTLENLECIHDSAELPVYSPLIGMNKEEIVSLARGFGTYELSIVPYPDCCSYNIAQHPETRGRLREIENLEKSIKTIDKLAEKAVSGVRTREFSFP